MHELPAGASADVPFIGHVLSVTPTLPRPPRPPSPWCSSRMWGARLAAVATAAPASSRGAPPAPR
eukprot:255027-Chlamydomonas_euryale.AAC.4